MPPRLMALFCAAIMFGLTAQPVRADPGMLPDLTNFDEGKLLATGGVSAVEGEGGGGLAPGP